MCYVCNWCSWTLDLLQRVLTFMFTCWMSSVVCCGLFITVVAGVALGYHYSFAEFITHMKHDVTVYMKRGHFETDPDIEPAPYRRMGNEDLFNSNTTAGDEEEVIPNSNSEPLARKWLKDDDARQYAMKLTKYKDDDTPTIVVDEPDPIKQQKVQQQLKLYQLPATSISPLTRRTSSIPILIPTTIWNSGSSEIILRKFLPLHDLRENLEIKESDKNSFKDNDEPSSSILDFNKRVLEDDQPDVKIRFDDSSERNKAPISYIETNSHSDEEDFVEDERENNIVYKPV